MFSTFKTLFQLVGGHALPEEEDGPARRMQLVAMAALVSVVLTAFYGFAVGAGHPGFALANLYKMPMVVLLSTFGAMPAALLAWKLVGSEQRASDLVIGAASGLLTGSLILSVFAPLVALYYVTSSWLGPVLALFAASTSVLVGIAVMVRSVFQRATNMPKSYWRVLTPVVAMCAMQLAILVQLIAVGAPILYEQTVFDGGMDAILGS